MISEKVTGLVLSRKLCNAGWREETEYHWAYDGKDRLLGKIWNIYHKSELVDLIDKKDICPSAPTSDELFNFIKKRCPNKIFIFEVKSTEKMANYLAEFILKNKLL